MTAESDFRKNTRAIEDVAKKLENLTKVLQSLDRTLNGILSYVKSEADEETERLQRENVRPRGVTVAEQNLKSNLTPQGICHRCYAGMCKTGEIYNDKCSCCNKSHRKTS